MTFLKCKMCGGDIQLTGATHGVCEYCGNEVTLPKIDDDKRADMFNRGNFLRMERGNFDQAYSAYEHIIADDQTDAEAHWCLMLCRYGIAYVQDKRTGEYKPTCSRMSTLSVLEDIDYLAAIENSDAYTAEIYTREAKKIYDIQKRFIEIARSEKPYDVFICFKAEDRNNERTHGSVVGQEIYDRLNAEGVRTFFSRITLENMAGEEYEPYIFSALNSAKVMLVIADSPENLQSRWVKNEWMRYLSIMDKDITRKMIPVCVGMSPYELPEEIPARVQAVDWSRVGAEQDLIRGILKIVGKLHEKNPPSAASAGINIDNKLKAVERELEDGEYSQAIDIADGILDEQPENAIAHFYLLLAHNKVNKLSELPGNVAWAQDSRFRRVMRYADEKMKSSLQEFLDYRANESKYNRAKKYLSEKNYTEASRIFESLNGFKDSAELAKTSKETLERKRANDIATNDFKKEVGTVDTYLERRLKQSDSDLIAKFFKLEKKAQAGKYFKMKKFLICLVLSLMLVGISSRGHATDNATLIWGIVFAVILHIRFHMDFSLIKSAAIAVGCGLLPVVLYFIFDYVNLDGVGEYIYSLISVLIVSWSVYPLVKYIVGKQAISERNRIYQSVILPEIEKIKKELFDKYSAVAGEQKANSLVNSLRFYY